MNQYQQANAARLIEGYYLPRPNDKMPAAFERAQGDCVAQLRIQLANVEALTLDQYKAALRIKESANG
jgi:hypothetical protein